VNFSREILELIERFDRNREAYLSGQYNETQLCREFIDPFFELLGWDVNNKQGYAEAYKDVIHEDTIKIGSATKAPDYCFRIGGTRKFFVEAKKPSVNLKDDVSPAFQLRRYAWSAKLPLSILTDFEEFAVYDCRVTPVKTDKASTARILYLTYKDYAEKWDEITSIFSREAILKGSFDKYAETGKHKRGTAEVDDAFLKEIESWRDILARNIALRNPELSQRELNFAVQRTIDRIIFLRICEDRGIEEYGRLMSLMNGANVYKRLLEFFRHADEKYNSGLFHFNKEKDRHEMPDELTPILAIDDKHLKDIIKRFYYPESPYEFSVLPANILGQVYEQFLGKVIRLTSGHRAIVEEKPEVRKAGGVYYTPTYIVDYIVKNTVGKLLNADDQPQSVIPAEAGIQTKKLDSRFHGNDTPLNSPLGKGGGRGVTPKEISKMKILDPACGSGSFLLGAYQYLLDWHRDWYINDSKEKWATGKKPTLYQAQGGDWHLTTSEKKRILLNNIYGVDIDSQAVEVTKLSLLLKVLEGENNQTIERQLKFYQERALPDLGDNIKCGNSLIGPDFYQQQTMLDEEERYRINVFDWNVEFPEIMKTGGFDAVIGNPPYGYMISPQEQEYFQSKYQYQDYQKDFYLLFLERYHSLLKKDKLLGVIVSNTWLQSVTFRKIRQYLTSEYKWQRILHLPERVFSAVVDTHVLIFKKSKSGISNDDIVGIDFRHNGQVEFHHNLSGEFILRSGETINIIVPPESQLLFQKIQNISSPLFNVCKVYNGVKPFEKGKGTPPQTDQIMKEKPFVKEGSLPNKTFSPLLRGSLIQRYRNLWNQDYWIKYGPWLAAPRDPAIFDAPLKIMVRQTGDSIIATLIEKGFIARNNLHILLPEDASLDLRFILGIMNSRLMDFVYSYINPEKGEALAEVKKHHVEQLPVRPINFSNPTDKAHHDKMVSLVDQMLSLNKQLASAKTDHEKTSLQRQIEATDRQIDKLVYELYGLTEEEIGIVEGGK
jgi:type I restriction-modification system DNA methylase subunit